MAEPREIPVEEWGRSIYVFPITLYQFDQLTAARDKGQMWQCLTAIRLLAKNEDGSPIYGEAEVDDIYKKGREGYELPVVTRVFGELVAGMSGLTEEVLDAAGEG